MIEKLIVLEPEQSIAIERLSRQVGLPEEEIIRIAIEQYLGRLNHGRQDLGMWIEELVYIHRLMNQEQPEQSPRSWKRDGLYDR